MHKQRKTIWLWCFCLISIVVFLLAALLPPVAQQVEYHQFADQRTFLGIPNFLNVASNLVFLICGAASLLFLLRLPDTSCVGSFIHPLERWPYIVLFFSVVMTCFGSTYYHWSPDNERLVWDRLPIAIGITALLAAIIVERISTKMGLYLLPWLVLIGVGSVLYWYWSEQHGVGNLNFYIVVQFYSLILIVLLGLTLPPRYSHGAMMHWVIGLYAVAKFAEMHDSEIYALGGLVSGHTLKHLIAALAVYWIFIMVKKRTPL